MPSSLEIAQEAVLRPIGEIAEQAGLLPEEYDHYGRDKAKVDLSVLDRLAATPDAKLICVTAITPTKAGEGKTTTSVSLTQGLGHIRERPVLCLRETGFDITAASEVMAIVAVARDLFDLRERLGAITVGHTFDGEPVTAEQLKAAGAMTVLLKDALKPNLVQTLEGQPAFVHCGPFANIAHGNNSLVADLVALKLGDYVVTESGFGSDMGMEKFLDIVCRVGGLRPSAIVLVTTVRALKHHGGDPSGGLETVEVGAANMRRHIENIRGFGLNAVVAVNRFPGDTDRELQAVRRPPVP